MRKTRKLTLVQVLRQAIKRLESNNQHLVLNFTSQSADLRQSRDRLAWVEEQAKRDRLLIEHLVETAKYAAAKGVQSGVMGSRAQR